MGQPLRVLIIEDSVQDAEILVRELQHSGYDPVFERVETASSTKMMLESRTWDIIISDYKMPLFSAMDVLEQLKVSKLDIPFIIISGTVGEDAAVASIKAGAHDFIIKSNLSRLVPAVERELTEAKQRQKYRQDEEALRKSEARLVNAQRIARMGNWEWDIVRDISYWSDELYRIFGFTHAQLRLHILHF